MPTGGQSLFTPGRRQPGYTPPHRPSPPQHLPRRRRVSYWALMTTPLGTLLVVVEPVRLAGLVGVGGLLGRATTVDEPEPVHLRP